MRNVQESPYTLTTATIRDVKTEYLYESETSDPLALGSEDNLTCESNSTGIKAPLLWVCKSCFVSFPLEQNLQMHLNEGKCDAPVHPHVGIHLEQFESQTKRSSELSQTPGLSDSGSGARQLASQKNYGKRLKNRPIPKAKKQGECLILLSSMGLGQGPRQDQRKDDLDKCPRARKKTGSIKSVSKNRKRNLLSRLNKSKRKFNSSPGRNVKLKRKEEQEALPVKLKVFKCTKCETLFETLEAFKVHQSEHVSPTEPQPTFYSCSKCDTKFGHGGELILHNQMVHNPDSPINKTNFNSDAKSEPRSKNPSSNSNAGSVVIANPDLTTAQLKLTPGEMEGKKVECKTCLRRFKYKGHLAHHMHYCPSALTG